MSWGPVPGLEQNPKAAGEHSVGLGCFRITEDCNKGVEGPSFEPPDNVGGAC